MGNNIKNINEATISSLKSIDEVKRIISENTFNTVKILLDNDIDFTLEEIHTKSSKDINNKK